ncbi:uncharacterized protein LOC126725070 [Quercus robur]|uniref:uncharacterized protein LOC126725070 n=1 Tax=Quercus robur TaxID=38942 RepID=UPI0021615A4A|nr:uncharacterized protein LOC126725070 [Quercus robur]
MMSIIVWNCKGALKPSFQNHVRELVNCHDPAIMVVMETRIGGDRARDISDRLPFDGAIHSDTIGFSSGIWLLWNSEKVQITHLAMSEQEVHVLVKDLRSFIILMRNILMRRNRSSSVWRRLWEQTISRRTL